MLPWIMLGASILANRSQKKDARKQALEELMIGHARELGADTTPLQAMQAKRSIDRKPTVDPGLLAGAVASTVESESVDERMAKEMAKRGLMRGHEPFDSPEQPGDYEAAQRYGQGLDDEDAWERVRQSMRGVGRYGSVY